MKLSSNIERGDFKRGGIYTITNLVNGKFYLGRAAYLGRRKNSHISDLRQGKHRNSKLQRAWNKYGESNFLFSIVEIVSAEKAIQREQYYLDKLKPYTNGYNLSKEAIGGDVLEVCQLDLQGSFIKTWNNLYEAANSLNICSGLIRLCISAPHKYKTAAGFQWCRPPALSLREGTACSAKSNPKPKAVKQYDLNGAFMAEYPSITKAAQTVNTAGGFISLCCSGKYKTGRGFQWCFVGDEYKIGKGVKLRLGNVA